MLLENLVSNIREYLDDESKTRFPEDFIISKRINDALKYIQREAVKRKIYLNRQSTTVSFTANTQEIALSDSVSSSFIKAILVKNSEGVPIPIHRHEVSINGDKESVYIIKTFEERTILGVIVNFPVLYIGYYLTPSAAFDVTLYYEKAYPLFNNYTYYPTARTDIIPEEHQDVVIFYTCLLLLGIHKDVDNFWYNHFQAAFETMTQVLNPENEEIQEVQNVLY